MGMPAFDTHKAVNSLTEAGAEMPLAEAVVTTIAETTAHLAMRTDLEQMGKELRQEISGLRQEMLGMEERLRQEMSGLSQEMTNKDEWLRQEMINREERLRQEMLNMEYRMIVKLGSLMTLIVGGTAALFRLFWF